MITMKEKTQADFDLKSLVDFMNEKFPESLYGDEKLQLTFSLKGELGSVYDAKLCRCRGADGKIKFRPCKDCV
ncbi:MAG: hypothetical protein ACOYXT_13655 [Bacteroidota bacterium]